LPFDPPQCERDATQEDLLCDHCRDKGTRPAVAATSEGHYHLDWARIEANLNYGWHP
jgi:hypothetical protein